MTKGKEQKKIGLERENAYRNKALNGRYLVATDEVRGEKSWKSLKQSRLKEEIQGMIMNTWEQGLRGRNINKANDTDKIHRMCIEFGERGHEGWYGFWMYEIGIKGV